MTIRIVKRGVSREKPFDQGSHARNAITRRATPSEPCIRLMEPPIG